MTKPAPYLLQFDVIPALSKEIASLKDTHKTQQEAVNAATKVIDELRKENQLLKANLYLREINNEIGRLKQEVTKTTEAYIRLSERYDDLMSKYITK